jgi:hypothetical protein
MAPVSGTSASPRSVSRDVSVSFAVAGSPARVT